MSNSNERKAKSLNDIPMIFKKRDTNNTESKNSNFKVSLGNVPDERSEENDTFHSEKTISNESKLLEAREFSKEETKKEEGYTKKFQVSTISIEERLDSNSKIGAFDTSDFVNTLLEDENLANRHKFKDILEIKFGKKKRVLSIIDIFLSLVLIAPLTVGYWRGVWTLMDIHVDIFPGVVTFVLGIVIHTSFAALKNLLHTRVVNAWKKKTALNKFFCKSTQILYTYIFGVACNMQWRGGWIIYDHFVTDLWAIITTLLLELTILVIIRAVRNLLAIPSVIAVDKLIFVFRFPTRYQLNTRDWSLYLLDCAFSVGVVGTLVVFVWRGVWMLLDLYLFPEDREYSAIGSLAIGYGIVTVTFSLQPLMRHVCARLQGLPRLIAADSFLLLSFLGTVNVWRGIWNILDLWLLPDNPELSCWITHVGCFVFLVLLNCSNSILVRGVYIDAEEDDGKCVAFPCHYLRLFFKVEREKKEARRRNLLVASKDFRPRADGNAKETENGVFLPNSNATTILPTNPESLV
nr:uncharacterized protein LOC117600938 isoform X1 [Osmia lignaria]